MFVCLFFYIFLTSRFKHKFPEDANEVPGGFLSDCNKVCLHCLATLSVNKMNVTYGLKICLQLWYANKTWRRKVVTIPPKEEIFLKLVSNIFVSAGNILWQLIPDSSCHLQRSAVNYGTLRRIVAMTGLFIEERFNTPYIGIELALFYYWETKSYATHGLCKCGFLLGAKYRSRDILHQVEMHLKA